MTNKRKVSATSVFFESFPYKVDAETGLIDYDSLEQNAKLFNPTLIVAGEGFKILWFDCLKFSLSVDFGGEIKYYFCTIKSIPSFYFFLWEICRILFM